MINTIGIKNFRSLKEIKIGNNEFLEIKPITILLGKNSSGKSSFLRIFPLLKQSVTSRTRGALALFGNEVDFGDFATTIFLKPKQTKKALILNLILPVRSIHEVPRYYSLITRKKKTLQSKEQILC